MNTLFASEAKRIPMQIQGSDAFGARAQKGRTC
jgi:hypothetical protein